MQVQLSAAAERFHVAINDDFRSPHIETVMPTETPEDDNAAHDEGEDEDFSLDDLGAAYAEALVEAGLAPEVNEQPAATDSAANEPLAHAPTPIELYDPPTPEGVVEAALFLGHPENTPLSARELARVMRDVSPKEVESIVERLNEQYQQRGHAMRIEQTERGFRMVLIPEMDQVRRLFYGKVREARLSQQALEILALVAYQPGITSSELADQRGRDCGPLLNQLVRRRLLELSREKVQNQGRAVSKYYPTERFLNLFGLSSLDDLPHVEEATLIDETAI